jgi:hypothetical protein
MNQQFPLPPPGIYVKTYLPAGIHTRLYVLLQPRYRNLLPPVEITGVKNFNLGLKLNQPGSDQSGSSCAEASGSKPEQITGLVQDMTCDKDPDGYAQLERYGEPELYAELFPKLPEKQQAHESHGLDEETGMDGEVERFGTELMVGDESKSPNGISAIGKAPEQK